MSVPRSIPLKDALERFTDSDLWHEFAGHFPNVAEARRVLLTAFTDPGLIAHYRARAAEAGNVDARRTVAELLLAKPVIDDFWQRAETGVLTITCRRRGLLTRESFPIELCPQLQFDSEAHTAEGDGHQLSDIQVALSPEAAESDFAKRLGAWLQSRRAERGDELKNNLLQDARAEFSDALSTRAFNEAYAALYGRKRGRPPGRGGK